MAGQPQEEFDNEYKRWAWIGIPLAVCAGFLLADGHLAALPAILALGVLIAAVRVWASGRVSGYFRRRG